MKSKDMEVSGRAKEPVAHIQTEGVSAQAL